MSIKTVVHRMRVFGLAAAALCILAGPAQAGISLTKHNLSSSSGNTIRSTDNPEICIFCHTPHDAIKNDNIPLWNHTLSTTASYGVYTSPTFDASDAADVAAATEAAAVVTNLCLSCHDGTVAINSLNNVSNINGTTTMTGVDGDGTLPAISSNLGTSLTNDHPVNFTYDATLVSADGGLHDPTTLANAIVFNGKVQCASCHDPHTSDSEGAFLRASMTESALCLECHNK